MARARPIQQNLRYGVVGLGHIAQVAVLPGMAQVKGTTIAALVSDDPAKLKSLGRKYAVAHTTGYEGYDQLIASGIIDAVYIALPNDMHHSYALRALNAGLHVLLEKPMAVTAAQCQELINAGRRAQRRLMIAYRLHFERANLRAVALAENSRLGDLRYFMSTFSMQVTPHDIRTRPESEGGGPLYDLGVYCINAARGLFRSEPIEVSAFAARSTDPRFALNDEMVTAIMRFPGERLATFTASFGASSTAAYDLIGTKGSLRIDPAYEYTESLRQKVTIKGKTTEKEFPAGDQFAAEIAYFSDCIRNDHEPEPSGAEGLADVRVIEAILASARSHRPVAVPHLGEALARPAPSQLIEYPATEKPDTVHVTPPHQND